MMNNIFKDKFSVGDKVTWRSDYWGEHNNGRRRYGVGPFTVISVEEVAESQQDGVAHTQFVHLNIGSFSGAYFKRVEEETVDG